MARLVGRSASQAKHGGALCPTRNSRRCSIWECLAFAADWGGDAVLRDRTKLFAARTERRTGMLTFYVIAPTARGSNDSHAGGVGWENPVGAMLSLASVVARYGAAT